MVHADSEIKNARTGRAKKKPPEGGKHLNLPSSNYLAPINAPLRFTVGHPNMNASSSTKGTRKPANTTVLYWIPAAHHLVEPTTEILAAVPLVGSGLGMLGPVLINALAGIIAGALVMAVVAVAKLGMLALRPSTE
ncbi:hypothetical protein [Cupriavidus basilensis]|uniref:hypothetical protein n=1 Tax=Cupriavidus basilensis TaxID=68895 RepID=UPI0020A62332|nr:hypothetical protein [Cupriavidus basilensis]MCP3025220.1 hypothetical protein [Cupriavidus basilensis]